MLNVERITQYTEPEKIQSLNNGYYYYNYDIKSQVVEDEEGSKIQYSFIQIKLHGKPDYKRCVQQLIRKYIDVNQEFDLINTYNSKVLSGQRDADQEYIDYLNLLTTIKENVKKDFNIN